MVKKMKVIVFDLQGTLINHETPPKLIHNAVNCLKELKNLAPLVLITTARGLDNVDGLLDSLKIKDFFSLILNLKEQRLSKADGSAFLEVAKHFNFKPSSMIIIGDVPFIDIAGAKRIGAKTIRVKHGKYATLEPQNTYEKADFEINSLEELTNLIKKLIS